MALVAWDETFSVGVKSLDGQHTILFGCLNDLHAAMMKGQGQSMTGPLLRKLVEYTHSHFAAEESMMESTHFPGVAEHKAKHRALVAEVENYVARFEKGEITLTLHLMNFLRDWLINHIQKSDHEYGPWLNEHGVR